jgi:hypothetical protein
MIPTSLSAEVTHAVAGADSKQMCFECSRLVAWRVSLRAAAARKQAAAPAPWLIVCWEVVQCASVAAFASAGAAHVHAAGVHVTCVPLAMRVRWFIFNHLVTSVHVPEATLAHRNAACQQATGLCLVMVKSISRTAVPACAPAN